MKKKVFFVEEKKLGGRESRKTNVQIILFILLSLNKTASK